jgi:antitoxin (DNA-binding transcriptional repressor) of toxin-antitoxin stability system
VKTLTATEVARNFSRILDDVEREQEEIVLTRNHRAVARLIPEPAAQNALEVLGDLYRTLDDETADALTAALAPARTVKGARKGKAARGTLRELRDPWVS